VRRRWGGGELDGWGGRLRLKTFERLGVAGVRGIGVGWVEDWGFPKLLPGKSGSARAVEQKLGEDCGKRLAAHSPFKVFRRVKGVGHTSRTSDGFRLG
jgi:hypothetical protein